MIIGCDHEHMFDLVVYTFCMEAALADITDGLGEGFAKLMLYVSEHDLCADDVVAIRRLVDTAELVCTRTVAKFAIDAEFRELGFRDIGSWMAAKTGARRTEGHARCEQARLLEDLPQVAAAVLAGTFSAAHLRCLSASVSRKRLALAQRDQAVFVNAALWLDASLFSQVVQRWVALADDELCDPNQPGKTDRQFDARRLQLSQMLDGMWRLNGVFDPVAGEVIEALLAAITPPPSHDDPRTPGQRRADGFIEFCQSFLAQQDRVHLGNERPNVNVVFHSSDGSAHTTGGRFLRNWQLSQVMCDATFTAVAATLKGQPFDVGTPLRAIPARNRKAVVVRDRCCRFPHCARPARWCEIHHILERENGGAHELPNLVLLCAYHHREVHRQGIKLAWDGPSLTARLPNGTLLHGPPHPTTQPTLL